jgi:cytochrome c-type biogenesis protein CcmI
VVIWVAAILLITAVGLFIAAPLSGPVFAGRSSAISAESERRRHEHALAVQALRELEFDQAMGKLGAGDYHELRERLENRALAAMDGREKAPRQLAGDLVPSVAPWPQLMRPARTVTVNFCAQCGARAVSAHNFCVNCGAALAVTLAAVK